MQIKQMKSCKSPPLLKFCQNVSACLELDWLKHTDKIRKCEVHLVATAFLVSSNAIAARASDPVNIHSSSTLGASARYEIVQSTLAARWTFRVDRVCGTVSQLVTTNDDDVTWQDILVVGLPKCVSDGKVRYQTFTSGLAARHTFLMNTETGKTWRITTITDKNTNEESVIWFPFKN